MMDVEAKFQAMEERISVLTSRVVCLEQELQEIKETINDTSTPQQSHEFDLTKKQR